MSLGERLDRLVTFLSPERGLARVQARRALSFLDGVKGTRSYEAGAGGRRNEGWITPSTSPNTALAGRLQTMRARSHYLCENNGFAVHAAGLFEDEIVGGGITPAFEAGRDDTVEVLEQLWAEHCEKKDVDADGMLDIYGLQTLAVRTIFESGEVLIRLRWRRLSDGLALPFQLELLEPDHLDESRDGAQLDGGKQYLGIRTDGLGRRTGYQLWPEHPGEFDFLRRDSRLVPADLIFHAYRITRPKQRRGVPALAPVLTKLRLIDDIEDFTLVNEQVQACVAGFISDPAAEVPRTGAAPTPVLPEKIEPGALVPLPNGKQIVFSTPTNRSNFPEFVLAALRHTAAGLDLPYEALTGDWSHVNGAVGRLLYAQAGRSMDRWRWNVLVTPALNPIGQAFIQAAQLAGHIPFDPVIFGWTPPRRQMWDPKTDVPAQRDKIRAGLTSPSEVLREEGCNPKRVWRELRDDLEFIRELGLKVESDPENAMRGSPNPSADTTGDGTGAAAKTPDQKGG